jgi:hypothetical protein
VHKESIKIGCQCAFKVEKNYVAPNLGFLHYYYMEHVNNQGVPCHGCQATMFKGMRLEYAP